MKLNRLSSLAAITLTCVLSLSASLHANWTASGEFQYTDRTYGVSGWTGSELLPIRFADVQVFDRNSFAVLATGATDENGAFSIFVVDSQTRDVGVRVLASSNSTPGLNIEVVDDQSGLAVYSYQDPTSDVFGHGPNDSTDFGVMVAPLAVGDIATTDWSSQVFNTYDQGVDTAQWIADVDGGFPNAGLTIRWNPNNGRSGSFYSGGSNSVYLSDDDGYDDPNILHEIGHYVEDEFGRSRNTGGSHTGGDDDQDPRLAWSEGYATFVSAAVRQFHGLYRPDVYSDRNSFGTSGGFGYGFEGDQTGGATQERAVSAALLDLVDDAGTLDNSVSSDDDPLSGLGQGTWDVIQEMRARQTPATRMEDFWTIWFELGLGNLSDMEFVFGEHHIDFFPDPQEPNDRPSEATSLVVDGSYQENTFYRTGPEAAGDEDWFTFNAISGRVYRIEVSGAANTIFSRPDPEMFLFDLDAGELLAFQQDPYDTQLNNSGSFGAQDMDETVPTILWQAPSSGPVHVMLRHNSARLNLTEFGTYQVRVTDSPTPPNPSIDDVAAQLLRPGQRYPILVRGDDFTTSATISAPNVTVESVTWIGHEVLYAEITVDVSAPNGNVALTVSNGGGASSTLGSALTIDANAQPSIRIREVDLGLPDRVELVNRGTVDADLTGWSVVGRSGTGSDQTLVIPGFTLPAGATVRIDDVAGTNTTTTLFDVGENMNWEWSSGNTGDVCLLDDAGRNVDYIRFVSRFVTTHQAPAGTGALWMQPELRTPSSPLTISRSPGGLPRTTVGLAPTAASLPLGSAGRENRLDEWEDNDSPRRAPIFADSVGLTNLAIHDRAGAANDVDWFGLVLGNGESLGVQLTFEASDGNLTLELYAPGDESSPIAFGTSVPGGRLIFLTTAETAAFGDGHYRVCVSATSGVPVDYELGLFRNPLDGDCDADGIPDGFALALGLATDCDGDGTIDACQLLAGDCDGNGELDACEIEADPSLDCNGNLILDSCDFADGTLNDNNGDGFADECPFFILRGEAIEAAPDQNSVAFRVLGTWPETISGYSVGATFDPAVLAVSAVDATGTVGALAEIFLPSFGADWFGVGVVMDLTPPIDQVLTPAVDQPLVRTLFDVASTAIVDSESSVLIDSDVGPLAVDSIFVNVGGSTILTEKLAGTVTIVPGIPFQRGDANGDNGFDLADPIRTLDALFAGGVALSCEDAADSNDDGALDIGDPVHMLNALFAGGPFPPAPFGACGIDPTDDTLGCAVVSCP